VGILISFLKVCPDSWKLHIESLKNSRKLEKCFQFYIANLSVSPITKVRLSINHYSNRCVPEYFDKIVIAIHIKFCYEYRSGRENIPLGSALAGTSLELRDVDVSSGLAELWIGRHFASLSSILQKVLFLCVRALNRRHRKKNSTR